MASGPIAFVTPRYGVDVVGGSEAVTREAAHGLARRGWDVEVLTTTARDHYSWAPAFPAGVSEVDGVIIRRFDLVHEGGRYPGYEDRADLERRIADGIVLDERQEQAWLNGLFRVPDLYHHLITHRNRYRAVVFSPYLFWTTLVGAPVVGDRAIVMPCLHDEGYARLAVVQRVLRGAGRAWYLSAPEQELAQRLGCAPPVGDLTGAGVHVPDAYPPSTLLGELVSSRPFILYAGRREEGKGWPLLLDAFAEAVRRGAEIDLVTMGVGPVQPPAGLEDRVHDLGFVPDEEAPAVFASAVAYVQPSANESFSRTVMEAWLAGTPVLANGASEVVRWHCERSGAGLVWTGLEELTAAIELVAGAPDVVAALAPAGRQYVLEHYTWPTVLDNMERSLEAACAG